MISIVSFLSTSCFASQYSIPGTDVLISIFVVSFLHSGTKLRGCTISIDCGSFCISLDWLTKAVLRILPLLFLYVVELDGLDSFVYSWFDVLIFLK